jgi:transposase
MRPHSRKTPKNSRRLQRGYNFEFGGIYKYAGKLGKYNGIGKISKRGNRHLRKILYSMVMCVVRYNSFFRSYYLRRKAEGLPPKKALLATAHKLIRVIFAMLSHKTFFNVTQNA